MTDKEIMELFIQVYQCLHQITMTLNYQQDIPVTHKVSTVNQMSKLEILINQTANRTNLPDIQTELYSLTKTPLQ